LPFLSEVLDIPVLVKRAQDGDTEAFAVLFRNYNSGLHTYLSGLVGNQEDAEDLAQTTFVKVWQNLPQLKDATRFKAWLYTIATNQGRDFLRARRRNEIHYERVSTEEVDAFQHTAAFEDALEERSLVEQSLMQLSLRDRECLMLQVLGFAIPEIASVLNIRKLSAATYISLARKKFRMVYDGLNSGYSERRSSSGG
jgi:RNA polymerase sigma-70 factor (ECF subfamily)